MLVNELVGGCNLEAMLMFDPDLFANMVVPDGVEKSGVIAAIRRAHGLAPLYHPDPFWMKQELYWWSRENLPIWKKLFATTQLEYNPIWNTDMSERTRDTTETTRDTSEQTTQHSQGGSHDQKQHADDRHIMETTGNLYHENTKDKGYTTDNTAGHGETTADETRNTVGSLNRLTTGNRNTVHDETMTDKVKTTKDGTSKVINDVSAENEAEYQPYDQTNTTTHEEGTSDETRKTDWTETEDTTGTQTDKTTEDMTDKQATTSDTIGRAHGTYGDTGSTDGHGHTERQNADRGTAQETAVNAHDEQAHGMTTGKETETVVMTHEYTKSGNIGVTTTQQMIEAERESVLFNIYQVIADSFHRTFCLDVY